MAIIQVKQSSGAIRLLSVTAQDFAAYRRDRAVIDAIRPLGAVDVFRDGREEWGCTGPAYRNIPDAVRAELRYAIGE